MIELDPLLAPIGEDDPTGDNLRYEPVYDEIKRAREEEDPNLPQGDWKRERKVADWAGVVKLTTDVLANRSKDLQVAAWLTEGLLRSEGFGGLRSGLELLRRLQEEFWEGLHPEIEEEDDLEFRAVPLEWVGRYLESAVETAPLTRAGFGLRDHDASRRVPSEEEAKKDKAKRKEREQAVAEGALTPEDFEAAFDESPKAWYKELVAAVEGSCEELRALDELCEERYGEVAPSFIVLREALEKVGRLADRFLARKLEEDPDPPEEEATEAAAGGEGEGAAEATDARGGSGAAPGSAAASAPAATPLDSWDGAADVAAKGARFMRGDDPTNPAPYLMLRGLRWGELRAGGTGVEPRLLEAPPTSVRTKLKGLLLDAEWAELLEAAEEVMATPWGRGWLDLQRYVITALDGLGDDYDVVAESVLQSIRGVLAHHPDLLDATLMDDSPTANRETADWLRGEVLQEGDGAGETLERGPARPRRSQTKAPDSRALQHLRSTDPRKAVRLLLEAASQEQSARARFLRRSEATRIMVQEGMDGVALPILQEMMDQIERHTLEEWEAGETVAGPMALLYRCMDRTGGDDARKEELYLRVCRLDPMQGMRLDGSGDPSPATAAEPEAPAEAEEEGAAGEG